MNDRQLVPDVTEIDQGDLPEIPGNELQALRAAIAAAGWRETTYLERHAYISIQHDQEAFEVIAEGIKGYGVKAKFQGKTYRYLYVDGYRYWRFKIILNRAKVEDGDGK